ncbi:hypothetical protein [Streptomyces sp. NPDC091371]|uniref:hypothetical protein n=1 Tax=Streptomyces sp. NPDC091371 TaxID=3155303 RepID=UPI0034240D4F
MVTTRGEQPEGPEEILRAVGQESDQGLSGLIQQLQQLAPGASPPEEPEPIDTRPGTNFLPPPPAPAAGAWMPGYVGDVAQPVRWVPSGYVQVQPPPPVPGWTYVPQGPAPQPVAYGHVYAPVGPHPAGYRYTGYELPAFEPPAFGPATPAPSAPATSHADHRAALIAAVAGRLGSWAAAEAALDAVLAALVETVGPASPGGAPAPTIPDTTPAKAPVKKTAVQKTTAKQPTTKKAAAAKRRSVSARGSTKNPQ